MRQLGSCLQALNHSGPLSSARQWGASPQSLQEAPAPEADLQWVRQDRGQAGAGPAPRPPGPYLAVTLARKGVTDAGRRAGLVAVTGTAAGVAVEAGSTGVTAAPSHIGSAPARGGSGADWASLRLDPSH